MKHKWIANVLAVWLVALLLSACGVFQQSAAQEAVSTVVLGDGNPPAASVIGTTPAVNTAGTGVVTASGIVIPVQEVNLAFALASRVQTLDVKMGDRVQVGQVLGRLAGGERLAAAVEAANLELLSAQKALADLQESAEQAYALAQVRVANAKDALDQAEKQRGSQQYQVGSADQIDVARANLILAEENLKRIEDVYGSHATRKKDDARKAVALIALADARMARDRALADLNYLLSLPNAIEVEQVDAGLQAAQAELAAAQIELEKWQSGPDPAEMALSEARIKNAQAQLAASQAALLDLELIAPFDGTVTGVTIHGGEWSSPGQTVVTLAEIDHLRVEATDLSERDAPRITGGQTAVVYITALGMEVDGVVAQVAPLADRLGGDVVYHTLIDLASIPEGLKAGMSVEVTFR